MECIVCLKRQEEGTMEVKISEELSREVRQKRTGDNEDKDCEMKECLERLNAWQTENLMAPHGMDRFEEPFGKTKSETTIKRR
jgi:SUMO ligase MMS21 Smc5/6 complex component